MPDLLFELFSEEIPARMQRQAAENLKKLVTDATRNSAPDVPWTAIVGMRNRLVHAYFDVDADLVWKTTSIELPALKARLQALV